MKGKSAILFFGVISLLILVFVFGSTFSDKKVQIDLAEQFRNDIVRDSLNSPYFWNKWVWNYDDPTAKIEYLKVDSGEGAGVVRKSRMTGKSGFKILSSNDDSLVYELVTDDQRFVERGVFYFYGESDGIKVKWINEIDFTRNVLARYKSYWTDYKSVFEKYQLDQLKSLDSLVYEKANE